MRAIVLSAGQGRRLLPLTAADPKCLLPLDGDASALEIQLRTLSRCGVDHVTVLVGFGAPRVERFLRETKFPDLQVETQYNPFFSMTDNLVTCWLARTAMTGDFILVNGDTLFEEALLRRVLDSPAAPITVTIDRKGSYDSDDMKVSLDPEKRLRAIGKTLSRASVDGESIGMLLFRQSGPAAFREALETAIRQPESLRAWYLSVVNDLAQKVPVETACIEGLWWAEIDSPDDLDVVRAHYAARRGAARMAASPASNVEF